MTDSTSKRPYGLRLRNLPRPEYHAMKAMVKRWHCEDESELFALLIRLAYEVHTYKDGDGEQWIVNALDCLRSIPEGGRIYTFEPL